MRLLRTHGCYALLLIGFAACAGSVSGADDRDLTTLRSHLVDYLTQSAPRKSSVERTMSTLKPDGSWPDVDYASGQRGGWPSYVHMARVLDMARAYRCSGHALEHSANLREAIVLALDHWLQQDYRNSNWWYGRIGIPRITAPILILMDKDLPDQTRATAIDQILARSKMGMTGQNKVWVAGIALMKGMLADDVTLIQEARDAILSELRITTGEGVQPDFSFHQHGPQQQWGNYGSSFGSDMIQWARIFQDTQFALDAAQWDILRNYVTEGPAWIVWRDRMDISGCGRQIFPGCQSSKGRAVLGQLRALKALDPPHAAAFDRILDSQSADSDNLLVGHKHYWRSDISVHRRPNWYASVKMSSTRVIGAETCNSENLLGLHLGDGVTYFCRTGDEYADLFPLWDWRRLPGTTCRQDDGSLVPGSKRCRGGSDFVGGASDGRRGLAVLEYRRDGLRAKKSWFFLDDAVVCLGAGIDCEGTDEVVTSIEQSVLSGSVVVSEAERTRVLEPGQCCLKNPDWIHHAGIGYCPLQPADVQAECAEKQGDWRRVHDQDRGGRTARSPVFSLWISHGASPRQAAYAYSVHPDASVESMPERRRSAAACLLQNSAAVQAISLDAGQTVLAAFFEPGRLSLSGDSSIEVDVPCLVLLERTADSRRLHVADPTHGKASVVVTLRGMSATPGETREIDVKLPRGERAGATGVTEF